jgi:opacity protein-like surface antigen
MSAFSIEAKTDNDFLNNLKEIFEKEVKSTKEKLKGNFVSIETEKMTVSSESEELLIYNTGVTFFYNYSKNHTLTTSLKKGISTDDVNYGSQSENVKLDYLFDISNIYKIKVSNKINLEMKAGINYFKFSTNDKDCKEFSPVIGLGLEYKVSKKFNIGVNFNKYYQGSEFNISGVNIGLRYKF